MRTALFDVLADTTRLGLVELLADREMSAGELAAKFQTSRPAVSRHLRVLREAGLVHSRGEAQRRVYRLDPAPLAEIQDWAEQTRRRWATRLGALEAHLERTHGGSDD